MLGRRARWAGVCGAVLLGLFVASVALPQGPPTETVVRNLIENFVGEHTVKSVRIVEFRFAYVHLAMDGVRAMPVDRRDWPWWFRDVTDICASRVFFPFFVHEGLRRLEVLHVLYTLGGKEIARGRRGRNDTTSTVVLTSP